MNLIKARVAGRWHTRDGFTPGLLAPRTNRPCVLACAGADLRRYLTAALLGIAMFHGPLHASQSHDTVAGSWQGVLDVGAARLTIVFHIELDDEGGLSATLDSPDQGATGIPVSGATLDNDRLTLDLPAIAGRYEGRMEARDTLSGTWFQGGQQFPLDLNRATEPPEAARRPQEPEPPLPYREEIAAFPNTAAGIRLAGTLTLPEGGGPYPAAVLIHGSGPHDRDQAIFGHRPFLVLADHLTRRGIAVLRYDKRGSGESGGDYASATTREFADDAAAAVEYLASRDDIETIGLIGHSEGGLIAPMVAAGSDTVSFAVLLAGPGLNGEEILYLQGDAILGVSGAEESMLARNREMQRVGFRIAKEETDPKRRTERLKAAYGELVAEMSPETRQALGIQDASAWVEAQAGAGASEWMRFFLMHDPLPVLREVEVPVLAMIGELDLQVPAAENLPAIESALAGGDNPDFTVFELPGLNHLFQTAGTGAPTEYGRIEETLAPAALEQISGWILERVGHPQP